MQNTHITIHQPGDYVFTISKGGRVRAYNVYEDGTVIEGDVADATAQTAIDQERARKEITF